MTSPVWGHVAGIVTVVLMVLFIGIWVWAWGKRHRANFRRMSRLPLEDSFDAPVAGRSDDNEKGDPP
jgi:cytochrome c oxidase cbb3-type subunit IV